MDHKGQINTFPYANRLGHYHIIKKIGQGGMSSVYEGFDEKLQRAVAIKILHPFLSEQEEYKKRFFREAQAGARLTHPNILQIYDVACEIGTSKENIVYIVTELVRGKTIKDFVNLYPLTSLPELCSMIVWQIAYALSHAHEKGIIHRDIKPENIMIDENGSIKLMDFGIASIKSDENLTQTGALVGSFAYMPPEIIQGKKAQAESDIFSLSVLFYWLLSLKMPFSAPNHHALLTQIVEVSPPKLQSLSFFVVDQLADIVHRGLLKNPQDRFSTALDLMRSIENFLKEFNLSMNEKFLCLILKNPQIELAKADKYILKQLNIQLKICQKNNQKIKAINILHRLNNKNYKVNKWNFYLLYKSVFLGILIVSFIFMFFNYFLVFPVPKTAPIPTAVVEAKSVASYENIEEIIQNNKEIKPEKNDLCLLNIVIWPFATIFLDNKQIAHDTKNFSIKLSQGEHKFRFIHPYAATYEKIIVIKDEKNLNLKIELSKTKPAFLILKTNVDVNIIIEDNYVGTSFESIKKPIIIKLPDKKHSITAKIVLQKIGYENFIKEQEFIAGKTVELEVSLAPLKN